MPTARKKRVVRDERTGLPMREVRLLALDARDPEVRKRIAEQVAALDPEHEAESIRWIEAVSEFDDPNTWTE
ncbi:antitoxin MazE-like protein [Neorhizobium petrolearium]|uniref:antitoxin MazE-like protein n=1 Tax=Neorhizobium petrolearium TaxID=515361 RepID=UPI003F15F87A